MVTSYLTYDMEQMMIRMRGEMLKRIAPNTLTRFFSPLLNIQGVSANEIEQAMDSLSDRYREKLLQKTFTEIQIEASEPFLETSEIVYQEADCAPIPESLKFSNPEDLKSSDTLKYLNF